MNAENIENMKVFMRSILARNLPVMIEDHNLAEKIFGTNMATCKDMWTKPKDPIIMTEDFIELPLELNMEDMEIDLVVDVVFINNEAFSTQPIGR